MAEIFIMPDTTSSCELQDAFHLCEPVLSDVGTTPAPEQSGTEELTTTGTLIVSSTNTVNGSPPSQLVLVKKITLPLVLVVPLGQLGQLGPSFKQALKKKDEVSTIADT